METSDNISIKMETYENVTIKMETFEEDSIKTENPNNAETNCSLSPIAETTNLNSWRMLAPKVDTKHETMYNLYMMWVKERSLPSPFSETVLAMYLTDQAKKLSPNHLKNTYGVLRSTILAYQNIDISQYKKLGMLISRCHFLFNGRKHPPTKMIVQDLNNTLNNCKRVYVKYCFVPSCDNNSKNYKCKKIFVHVPENRVIRKRWYEAVYGTYNRETPKSTMLFCCEDHFDLERDAKNFMMYKTIGCKLYMREDVVPHKNLGRVPTVEEMSEPSVVFSENMLEVSLETEPQLCPLECRCKNEEILPDTNDCTYSYDRITERIVVKYCFVPDCGNNSKLCPHMLFIRVPDKKETRQRWYSAVHGYSVEEVPKTTMLFCCEQHFDKMKYQEREDSEIEIVNDEIEKDAKNFMFYKTMGGSKLLMREDVVPHKNISVLVCNPTEVSENTPTIQTENLNVEESGSQVVSSIVEEPTTDFAEALPSNDNESCLVPNCPNNYITTPNKLFIPLPKNYKLRNEWIWTIGRGSREINVKNMDLFVCEDHFDIENDLENYMMLKVMNWKGKKIIKKGILPHKFEHLKIKRQKRRPAILRRRKYKKKKKVETNVNCKFEEVFVQEHFEENEDVPVPIKEEIEDSCSDDTRLPNEITENTETVYIKQESEDREDSDINSYVSDNNTNSATNFEHINFKNL